MIRDKLCSARLGLCYESGLSRRFIRLRIFRRRSFSGNDSYDLSKRLASRAGAMPAKNLPDRVTWRTGQRKQRC